MMLSRVRPCALRKDGLQTLRLFNRGLVHTQAAAQRLHTPGTAENQLPKNPKQAAKTESATLVFNGNPLSSEEYFALSFLNKKRCRKETSRTWPPETVRELIPEMIRRNGSLDAEPRGQNSPLDMIADGEPVSLWLKFFRSNTRNQRRALEDGSYLAQLLSDPVATNKALREVEMHVTDLKFRQNVPDSDLRRVLKGWDGIMTRMRQLQSGASVLHESPLQGLVWKGLPEPWAIYMARFKSRRNDILSETWLHHQSRIPPAKLLLDITLDMEKYISLIQREYYHTEEAEKKIRKARGWVDTIFRKMAGKNATHMFREYEGRYERKKPPNNAGASGEPARKEESLEGDF